MKVAMLNIGQLFSMSRDAVVCTQDEAVIYMNPSAISLFGNDHTGRSISTLLPVSILTEQSAPFSASAVICGKDVIVTCSTYQEMKMYCFICQDVHVEKTGEHAISVAMRNLSNTIKVTAQMIMNLSEKNEDERLYKYAAMLSHSTHKLTRLIGSHNLVTAFADGTQAFHPTVVCLSDVCSEAVAVVSDLADDHGVTIDYSGEPNIYAAVDVPLFQHMLLNLISNSLLNTTAGGQIHIDLKFSGKFITLTVTDTGRGIPDDQLPALFHQHREPVTPHSEKITNGLGLAAADAVAKLHDGTIIIQSTPGKGTTVAVQMRRNTKHTLMSPRSDYSVSLTDMVMTELSTWLTWEDYIPGTND